MTKNQIDYQRALEDQRHNLETEKISRFKEEENVKRQKAESYRRELAALEGLFESVARFQETKTKSWKNMGDTVGGLMKFA